jgi:hypothetical protein
MTAPWVPNGIATLALVASIIAAIASAFSALFAIRAIRLSGSQFDIASAREERFFKEIAERDRRVQIASAYMTLETQSSDIFRHTGEHAEMLLLFRGDPQPAVTAAHPDYAKAREVTLNLYYQSLNLFEVSARFRRDEIMEHSVFASWVAWFIELLDDQFFRDNWPNIRANYTPDVRDIFDVGTEIYGALTDPAQREAAFYDAVADIMECEEIRGWTRKLKDEKRAWKGRTIWLANSNLSGTNHLPA